MIRRRTFIAGLGAAAAWPLAARGQQKQPVIGYIDSGARDANTRLIVAFQQGVKQTGYVEGESVAVEYRFADGNYDRLQAFADDFARRGVAVIVATGGEPSAAAARAATATIPIVFDTGTNPVDLGWVKSLNRPGGIRASRLS
jgi:putative tryptophan/tyrosine transport system substrate-binding protein